MLLPLKSTAKLLSCPGRPCCSVWTGASHRVGSQSAPQVWRERVRMSSSRPEAQDRSPEHANYVNRFKQFVPTLSGSNYKGQNGKVGVLGGCREYTGAPFFSAMSATKVGADLTYVFCTESAATPIKSYSPEMIVMPLLPEMQLFAAEEPSVHDQARLIARAVSLVVPWVLRLSCLVVGPGLGDDPLVVATAAEVMRAAREAGIPMVVDGSGINLITRQPELVQGYRKCVVTPNVAELGRIAAAVGVHVEGPMGSQWQVHTQDIARALSGPVLVSKGPVDVITDGHSLLMCALHSSPKRSGGQGDVLTGVTAAFTGWVCKGSTLDTAAEPSPLLAAAYTACSLMRDASLRAFAVKERSMVAGDIIPELHASFKQYLVSDNWHLQY